MKRFITSPTKVTPLSTSFVKKHQARIDAPSIPSKQTKQNYNWWLYRVAAFTCLSALTIHQTLPEKNSLVRQQFDINARYSKDETLANNAKKIASWAFILWGTGFAGALSRKDVAFQAIANSVESWMQYHFHTVFTENLASDGKRNVFFRGETALEAEKVLRYNRSPLFWSLISGEIGLPMVADPTLDPTKPLPSGYTRGVISLTTDLHTTLSFGRGEAVLVVVPTKQRVAAVSQHGTKEDHGNEWEYICGGVHRTDILGVAYRNMDTQEFNRFDLNPGFKGNIRQLRMDEQMWRLINLLPDSEQKSILLGGIDPNLRAQDHYDNLLATDATEHQKNLAARTTAIATNGFNGNRFFQTVFQISQTPVPPDHPAFHPSVSDF